MLTGAKPVYPARPALCSMLAAVFCSELACYGPVYPVWCAQVTATTLVARRRLL
jgi:hypothetical protein